MQQIGHGAYRSRVQTQGINFTNQAVQAITHIAHQQETAIDRLTQHRLVFTAIDDNHPAWRKRRGGHRVMRLIHEHQRFGKSGACLDDFDNLFLAIGRNPIQLDPARQHQVKAGRIVALKEQRLTLDHVGDMAMPPHTPELSFVEG
jgi:hypothetical protein